MKVRIFFTILIISIWLYNLSLLIGNSRYNMFKTSYRYFVNVIKCWNRDPILLLTIIMIISWML